MFEETLNILHKNVTITFLSATHEHIHTALLYLLPDKSNTAKDRYDEK